MAEERLDRLCCPPDLFRIQPPPRPLCRPARLVGPPYLRPAMLYRPGPLPSRHQRRLARPDPVDPPDPSAAILPQFQGAVFFSSNSFETNPNGWCDSLQNNYYNYPALIPPMPWIDSTKPHPPRFHIDYDQKEFSATAFLAKGRSHRYPPRLRDLSIGLCYASGCHHARHSVLSLMTPSPNSPSTIRRQRIKERHILFCDRD